MRNIVPSTVPKIRTTLRTRKFRTKNLFDVPKFVLVRNFGTVRSSMLMVTSGLKLHQLTVKTSLNRVNIARLRAYNDLENIYCLPNGHPRIENHFLPFGSNSVSRFLTLNYRLQDRQYQHHQKVELLHLAYRGFDIFNRK